MMMIVASRRESSLMRAQNRRQDFVSSCSKKFLLLSEVREAKGMHKNPFWILLVLRYLAQQFSALLLRPVGLHEVKVI
jgi:dipeptide/tripeptide permease